MIAIHTKSGHFAPGWVAYCHENDIAFKEVDCFTSDIIQQLRGCTALLWHWPHHDYRAQLFARQLIASVEEMGLLVFPNTATCWHYDDKVGQKYLLEAIDAPLIPTFVFYDRRSALEWIEETTFPKVWKLRGGAGSQNVHLVRSRQAARKIVKRSFGSGWNNSRFHAFRDRIWHFRRDRALGTFLNIGRGAARIVFPRKETVSSVKQSGYVYFQEFVPNNTFDIRIQVIGNRAFGLKRFVRSGDFRASGSGQLEYDPCQLPLECVEIAFDVCGQLNAQSLAFDFVVKSGRYLIVEISYAFPASFYSPCPGYWDSSLNWQAGPITPERFILEDVLHALDGGLSDVG